MKKLAAISVALATATLLPACMSASQHRDAVRDDSTSRITVGKVQREIKVGMTGAGVTEVLGSPNIVTTDEERHEVWIYDKISTESVRSESKGGILALILGGGHGAGAGVGGGVSRSAGADSKSQRTLTVVIKFNDSGTVKDFAYHTSRF